MIISEKQIGQLIIIAQAYIATMHRLGKSRNCEQVQDLLVVINDQQSEELKEIKDE